VQSCLECVVLVFVYTELSHIFGVVNICSNIAVYFIYVIYRLGQKWVYSNTTYCIPTFGPPVIFKIFLPANMLFVLSM
jgi:uncharacterized membrane protein